MRQLRQAQAKAADYRADQRQETLIKVELIADRQKAAQYCVELENGEIWEIDRETAETMTKAAHDVFMTAFNHDVYMNE